MTEAENRNSTEPRYRFYYLLGSLLMLLVGMALADKHPMADLLFCVLFSAVLLAAVMSICQWRGRVVVTILVAMPILILNVAKYAAQNIVEHNVLTIAHDASAIVFLAFVSFHILSAIIRDQVTWDTIAGAISLYMLIALMWTFQYSILITVDPEAIQSIVTVNGSEVRTPISEHVARFEQLVYFSFVTLTTLGYGDTVPVSSIARTTSYLETLFGQFYMAVLVARLVAVFVTQSRNSTR
jgi:voltage-gated potassium channel